ncbi:polyprenyl synthetase family protein [Streptomyces sp. MS06]|uniref:polyprenyl synthetase family protein n=1 Tax=Streptomyces sp. MS06 TaxID=3385974 RepID=UPI0039A2A36C
MRAAASRTPLSSSDGAGASDGAGDGAPARSAPGPDTAEIRRAVDAVLGEFLDRKLHATQPARPAELIEALRDFVFSGGKRIRPVLCVCGWYAAGGGGDPGPVLRAAASLELFQAFALVHDDLMDASRTRRGRQSAHRLLADLHRRRGGAGDADRFGANAALLLGDLALVWSDELLHTADLEPGPRADAWAVLDVMRTEVMSGQYLDLLGTGRPVDDVERALTVVRYKSAKYSVERPLHLGVALAGGGERAERTRKACTAYALPLGEAFQLRDDLLGVFGDPERTGKPAVDDLREGKATVLMALALSRATPAQLGLLRTLVGDPELDDRQAAAVREVLEESGARHEVERMITSRCRRAVAVLDTALFPPPVAGALRRLAREVCTRSG